jgi:hypothetical protein
MQKSVCVFAQEFSSAQKTVRVFFAEMEFDLYRAQKQKLLRVQALGMTSTVGAKIGSPPIHSQK